MSKLNYPRYHSPENKNAVRALIKKGASDTEIFQTVFESNGLNPHGHRTFQIFAYIKLIRRNTK